MGTAGGLHASPPPSPLQQVFIEHLLCVSRGVLGASMGDTILPLKQLTWHVHEGPGLRGTP